VGLDREGNRVATCKIQNVFFGALLLLTVTAAISHAQQPDNRQALAWDRDIHLAWQDAVKTQRPLLVFITMDDCLYCKKMKKSTLQDEQVVDDLRSQFVPVALNAKDAPELMERLKIKSFPTTIVVEINGDVVDAITGYKSASQLRQRLRMTLRRVAQERIDTLRR